MSDTDNEQSESVNPIENDATEPGFLSIQEKDDTAAGTPDVESPVTDVKPPTPLSSQARERAGTVEHLAARRTAPTLDTSAPAIKQTLSELRTEITRLLTELRWEDQSITDTAEQLIPLLSVGSVQQWKPVLIPFLYEIDRGGVLIPIWLDIIDRGDPPDVPDDSNPADTMLGRARRFAILMLGNYRMMGITGTNKSARSSSIRRVEVDLTHYLGKLATDPNTSLYATQSLVKHATVPAIQALVTALKDAQGWAKVDVVDGCLELNQERFYDLLIASGLDNAPGLESYLAIPIYRTIPLEKYLRSDSERSLRLTQNAALIFSQVLQDSITPPGTTANSSMLPVAFERDLSATAFALFEGSRSNPQWQNTVALHRLGLFLGRYWSEISRGTLKDVRIVEPVYRCLPMMNDLERWMAGPGRDVLLSTLSNEQETVLSPTVKVLGEMREPRAISLLSTRIENTKSLADRQDALTVGTMCDTLAALDDRRAVAPMLQLAYRVVDVTQRSSRARLRDNLPSGDPHIPGSIVYAAVVRASGKLGDRHALEGVVRAINDFDPYVRNQAIEAIKQLDPNGDDSRSRVAVRMALTDPRETVVRTALQLVAHYRDSEAASELQRIVETRPELSYLAQDTLRQLG